MCDDYSSNRLPVRNIMYHKLWNLPNALIEHLTVLLECIDLFNPFGWALQPAVRLRSLIIVTLNEPFQEAVKFVVELIKIIHTQFIIRRLRVSNACNTEIHLLLLLLLLAFGRHNQVQVKGTHHSRYTYPDTVLV